VCELGDCRAADRVEHERQLVPFQRSFQLPMSATTFAGSPKPFKQSAFIGSVY
jgi:hypothetical protein